MIDFACVEIFPDREQADSITMITTNDSLFTTSFRPDPLVENLAGELLTKSGFDTERETTQLSFGGVELLEEPETGLFIGPEPDDVIDRDDRVEVKTTKNWPYSAIGLLTCRLNNGKFLKGTGVLIGRNHVLTAAHCLYEDRIDGWISQVQFEPGRKEGDSPFGFSQGVRCFVPNLWIENHISKPSIGNQYDIGIIRLKNPLGEQCGYYGLAAIPDIANRKVSLTGYPRDTFQMFTQTDSIVAATPSNIIYALDTEKGQSGSPIYTTELTSLDPLEKILGIHSRPNVFRSNNKGIRINQDFLQSILQVVTQN